MNKELNRKRLHELLDMCLDTNDLEERQRGKTGDKPTAFFEYSGHVNMLFFRVFPDGWSEESTTNDAICFDINLDKDVSDKTIRSIARMLKAATNGD